MQDYNFETITKSTDGKVKSVWIPDDKYDEYLECCNHFI